MKILIFPQDKNPYQELLYAEMRKQGDSANYLSNLTPSHTLNLLILPIEIFFYRLWGYKIFHLHWVYSFLPKRKIWQIKPFNNLAYWHYLFCLKTIKFLGYKLVWTAHNVLPHEKIFFDDIAARIKLVSMADLVIVHSAITIEELKKIGVELKHFIIIPHGSYVGVYPNAITRKEAKEKMSLKADSFVYLFLGLIRKYKGVEELLHAYKASESIDSNLVIAGKCEDGDIKKMLREFSASSSILWHDKYIDDADLQTYFAAADVVVLPFKKVITSGSAFLALSFGKAVIVPSLGELTYLPDSIAYKYSPGDMNALIQAIKDARKNPLELQRKSAAAKKYAESLSWPAVAKATHDAMQELFVDQ